MSFCEFDKINGAPCECGKEHFVPVRIHSGRGAIDKLVPEIESYKAKKVFLLADKTTYKVAGEKARYLICGAGMKCVCCILDEDPEPDEKSVGSAVMHYDYSADIVVAVGSGVVNDIGKIVAAIAKRPYIIVATAPSMDGYASASSSMTRGGLKISLPSKSADVIIGDTAILASAPDKMLAAGLGDMLAKYVSICEWRIANLLVGEYYCERIADLVRGSLKKCIDNKDGLLLREDNAIEAVFEGLVTCGAAMAFAGLSRPASGVEHYFSHVWDMRGAEFGTPVELHGIQCALGTLMAAKMYDRVRELVPDREKALSYVRSFDYAKYSVSLKDFLGRGAEAMIELEKKEKKYDPAEHEKRLDGIVSNWDNILSIINEEVPSSSEIEAVLDAIGAPKSMKEIGLDESILPMTFAATKDIRDKYVLSRLCFDLGVIYEISDELIK